VDLFSASAAGGAGRASLGASGLTNTSISNSFQPLLIVDNPFSPGRVSANPCSFDLARSLGGTWPLLV